MAILREKVKRLPPYSMKIATNHRFYAVIQCESVSEELNNKLWKENNFENRI